MTWEHWLLAFFILCLTWTCGFVTASVMHVSKGEEYGITDK